MPIALCMRNVTTGDVLVSLAVYLFLFIFVWFFTARFWRNKDAYSGTQKKSDTID